MWLACEREAERFMFGQVISDFSKVLGGVLDCMRRRFGTFVDRLGLALCHDIICMLCVGISK
jgi:hypothetical protein